MNLQPSSSYSLPVSTSTLGMEKRTLPIYQNGKTLWRPWTTTLWVTGTVAGLLLWWAWKFHGDLHENPSWTPFDTKIDAPYGQFPKENDPFHFMPCTNSSILPPLEDPEPLKSWASLFDPNPDHWSWGQPSSRDTDDLHVGQGIYMRGYLDLPLDYLNRSEARIVRLAITKYQPAFGVVAAYDVMYFYTQRDSIQAWHSLELTPTITYIRDGSRNPINSYCHRCRAHLGNRHQP